MKGSNCNIKVILDSGETLNIIENAYQRMGTIDLVSEGFYLIFPYGSRTPLPTIGKFTSLVESKAQFTDATFHVLQGSNGSLHGFNTASQLELI